MFQRAQHRVATSTIGCAVLAAVAGFLMAPGTALAATSPSVTVNGVPLAGSTLITTPAVVLVSGEGAVSAKFVLDGTYLGQDKAAPFMWALTAGAGAHQLTTRLSDAAGTVTRLRLDFTVSTSAGPGASATPAPVSTTSASPTASPTPSPAPSAGGRAVSARSVTEIRQALATALPGDVITVADGEYTFKPRLVASANGTAATPVTIQGSRAAVLRSPSSSGDYGLQVTGDYWRVGGLTVAHATKGIVLDGSVGTVIDGVEVYDIGDEGVHFRACSSDGVLRNSYVHDTGVGNAAYGEGVYVGSANSNWSGYACTDGRDNSERVLVEKNVFRHIAAEGADLKEGTDSGVLRDNLFDNTGFGGQNSADSAVDAKGNGWLIEGNTVINASGAFLDGFQSHSVYAGYGTGNAFRANTVVGRVPGYGIGFYPSAANTVACDNSAPNAVKGLASVACR